MIKLLLKLCLIYLLLFSALTALVRAVTYNDQTLDQTRKVLSPSACALPCFMGIYPGKTTRAEALAILKDHLWVFTSTESRVHNPGWSGIIVWTWNGFQPPWISTLSNGVLRFHNDIIGQIEIDTLLPFNDIWMMFAQPDTGTVRPKFSVASSPQISHYAVYDKWGFWVRSDTRCPLNPVLFWSARTHIIIGAKPDVQTEPYYLPGWFAKTPNCRR